MSDSVTWRELLAEATELLGDEREARFVCEHAAGLDASEFAGSLAEVVSQQMGKHVQAIIGRRLAGIPLQYAIGRWGFRHLDLMVDERVLIPRPETELVAEAALQKARSTEAPRVIVDLGTGSGAIGLSLAYELPIGSCTVWLTDASSDALHVARANLAGIGRHGAHVRIREGDWFGALPDELRGNVDVIVSNPPYVAVDDPDIDDSVVSHEPHQALFAGPDGLNALRTIIAGAGQWLREGGSLVVEIGHRQAESVRQLLRAANFVEVEIRQDLAGHDRVAIARLT